MKREENWLVLKCAAEKAGVDVFAAHAAYATQLLVRRRPNGADFANWSVDQLVAEMRAETAQPFTTAP